MPLPNPKTLDVMGVKGFAAVLAKPALGPQGRGLDIASYRTGAAWVVGSWASEALAGQSSGVASGTGAVSLAKRMVGTSAGGSTESGAVSLGKRVSAVTAGHAGGSGSVSLGKRIGGMLAGAGGANGGLLLRRGLSGRSDGAATAVWVIRLVKSLAGESAGAAGATGMAEVRLAFVVALRGVLEVKCPQILEGPFLHAVRWEAGLGGGAYDVGLKAAASAVRASGGRLEVRVKPSDDDL